MKKWFSYLLVTLCSYLIFLLATLPAVHVYAQLKDQLPGIDMRYIDGSIWDGSAKTVTINRLSLGPVYWTFKPLSLFTGAVEFQITTTDKEIKASGYAGINLMGQPYVSDLQGSSSLNTIKALLPRSSVEAEGLINFNLQEIHFEKQHLSSVTGNLVWQQAGVKRPIAIQIGNLQMDLSSDEQGIHGKISDKGAVVGVDGEINLQQNGRYQLKGRIEPKSDTPGDLLNALNMLGRSDPSGAIAISYSGSI